MQRDDDKRGDGAPAACRSIHQNNDELIPYYQDQGLLQRGPGHGDIETIYSQL